MLIFNLAIPFLFPILVISVIALAKSLSTVLRRVGNSRQTLWSCSFGKTFHFPTFSMTLAVDLLYTVFYYLLRYSFIDGLIMKGHWGLSKALSTSIQMTHGFYLCYNMAIDLQMLDHAWLIWLKVYSNFLFHCCDKYQWPKQLGREMCVSHSTQRIVCVCLCVFTRVLATAHREILGQPAWAILSLDHMHARHQTQLSRVGS